MWDFSDFIFVFRKHSSCFNDLMLNYHIPVVLTWLHSQLHMVFLIIEPAWYVHTAAIHPWVALQCLPDGQRHITRDRSAEQVALWQSADHRRPVWLDHLTCTATAGNNSSAPAYRQRAVVLGIIAACQSNIISHLGYNFICRQTTCKGGSPVGNETC